MTDTDQRGGGHRRRWWGLAAAVLSAGLAVGLGSALLGGPAFVERVSVVNDSPYDIHVEVTGEERAGWLSVTTADHGATGLGLEVIDQGPIWIFRFTAQGRGGGELRVLRGDLQQAGWTIEVPDAVIDRLRQAGATPTP